MRLISYNISIIKSLRINKVTHYVRVKIKVNPSFFKWECVKKQLVIQQMRCNFLHQDKKTMVIFMHLIMIVLKTKFINMNRVILSYKVMSFTYLKKSNRFNFTDISSNIMKTQLQNLTILLLMMLKYLKSKIYPSLIIH